MSDKAWTAFFWEAMNRRAAEGLALLRAWIAEKEKKRAE